MHDIRTIVDDEIGHVPEDDDQTLPQHAATAHETPLNWEAAAWALMARRGLPTSEHLIPFRT